MAGYAHVASSPGPRVVRAAVDAVDRALGMATLSSGDTVFRVESRDNRGALVVESSTAGWAGTVVIATNGDALSPGESLLDRLVAVGRGAKISLCLATASTNGSFVEV